MKKYLLLLIILFLCTTLIPANQLQAFQLTFQARNMTPHIGQKFEIRVISQQTNMEVVRSSLAAIPTADFDLVLDVPASGEDYWVDFYADFNSNGDYNAPPIDHAWRMVLSGVTGDTILTFTHNTNFTDIMWVYLFTLDLSNMTPHIGNAFYLRVVDMSDLTEVGRTIINPISQAIFSVSVPGIEIGKFYNIDFYADFNNNGVYDTPPTDHAWRMELMNVQGDETLSFIHNTNFTDIQWPLSVSVNDESRSTPQEIVLFQNSPNPFNVETYISFNISQTVPTTLEVFNIYGQRIRSLVNNTLAPGRYNIVWNGLNDSGNMVGSGIYFYKISTTHTVATRSMTLLK
jgi:hypothetical protein